VAFGYQVAVSIGEWRKAGAENTVNPMGKVMMLLWR
jgi:hypothetical protein